MQTKSGFRNKNFLDHFSQTLAADQQHKHVKLIQRLIEKTESTAGWLPCVFGLRLVCVCQRNVLRFQPVWSCDVWTELVQRTDSWSEQGILSSCNTKQREISLPRKCKRPLLHIAFSWDFKKSSPPASHTWQVHVRPGGRFEKHWRRREGKGRGRGVGRFCHGRL